MASAPPRILIAAIPEAARVLSEACQAFHCTPAYTFDEAMRRFREKRPDLVLVSYHFDERRPHHLIQHIRAEEAVRTPLILVRVLPPSLGKEREDEIARAYEALGVDAFVSLHDDQQRLGLEAALQRFRNVVAEVLRRRTGS